MIYGHGDDTFRFSHIRTNFSSNIYGHADLSALKAYLAAHLDAIQNYPEPAADSLAALIAQHHAISTDNVLVTNGATDAIYLIAQTFARDVTHFSTDEPTFSEYADASILYGLKTRKNTETSEKTRKCLENPERTQESVSEFFRSFPCFSVVRWLCNPNNPDGRIYTPEQICEEARHSTLLVVDQSYEHYTQAPLLSPREALDIPNLLLLHSLTKTYAVPGLRIGYVTGPATLIGRLRAAARPWAVNALAVEAGKWLFSHNIRAIDDLPALLAETQRFAAALARVPHLHVTPTATTFMLVRCDTLTAAELKQRLATEHHLLIRDASNFPTLTPHHFRIATQTSEENDTLVHALRSIIIDDSF
ncbi:MAG: aminotransferase class I/II-fold pyridoxal phosphate-dependent enzyme [Bacteroidaceae bacterium]|nr:aminotransferase class I/II-fold pyridoxal phosphate-dependent enzyme [Bacteroidaceae bacterium]